VKKLQPSRKSSDTVRINFYKKKTKNKLSAKLMSTTQKYF